MSYKTKDGTVVKFRVRVKRKGFEVDKLFATLKEARECISLAGSPDGRVAMTQFSETERLAKEAMQAQLDGPTVDYWFAQFHKRYLDNKATPTKELSSKKYLGRIKVICDVELGVSPKGATGMAMHPDLRMFAKGAKRMRVGSMKPDDFDEALATEFIIARKAATRKDGKPIKIDTVKGDVSMIQSMFSKLRFMDPRLWQRMNRINPFLEADKSLLKDNGKKRKRRISEAEEDALFRALEHCENPEMPLIFALALTTGCRRGELLEIRWEDVKRNVIEIQDGKGGYREVVLNEDSRAVLAKIPKVDERLFHYTSSGFNSNWQRAKKWAGMKDVRLHDARREFISRILESISNPVVISEMTSMRDATHIQKSYIDPLLAEQAAERGIRTEEEARKTTGHSSRRMSAHYYSRKSDDKA